MTTLQITRRTFLGFIAAALAAGSIVPAMDERRKPYVAVGEVADYVGRSPGGFIGGQQVSVVHDWDGIGYPVDTWSNSPSRTLERYYDFDLADFRRELPPHFWRKFSMEEFPNVHTWLRTQRFGESVAGAIKHLNFYSGRLA